MVIIFGYIYTLSDLKIISIIFNLCILNLNKKVGSRCKKPLEFFWSDDSVVNPKFFSTGNPDNHYGTATVISQGCLHFWATNGLDDDYCSSLNPFVCNQIWGFYELIYADKSIYFKFLHENWRLLYKTQIIIFSK